MCVSPSLSLLTCLGVFVVCTPPVYPVVSPSACVPIVCVSPSCAYKGIFESPVSVDPSSLEKLMGMGFNRRLCIQALLKAPNGDVDAALEHLLGGLGGDGAAAGQGGQGTAFYLCNREEVLLLSSPAAKRFLVDPSLDRDLQHVFAAPRFQARTNVRSMDPFELGRLLPDILPGAWQGKVEVTWNPPVAGSAGGLEPSREWVRAFWRYVYRCDSLSVFASSEQPLLPCDGGRLCSLANDSPIIDATNLAPPVKSLLEKANVRFLSMELFSPLGRDGAPAKDTSRAKVHPDVWNYVHKGDRSGILAAVQAAVTRAQSADPMASFDGAFEACTAGERTWGNTLHFTGSI